MYTLQGKLMEMPMQIRVAQPADVEAVTAVINAAFKRAESFFIARDRVDTADVRGFLQTGEFLLLEDERSIAGCVYVEKRGDRAYTGLLAVDPSRQGSGLGSNLMTAAEEHAYESGCHFMDLRIVSLRLELPAFYSHRGYTQTGTEQFTPGIETRIPCHFINMSKPLTGSDAKVTNR